MPKRKGWEWWFGHKNGANKSLLRLGVVMKERL